MQAVKLKQVDMDYRNHLQAYLNFAVKAEKKAGKHKTKPVFANFEKFFNYKAAIEEAKIKKSDEKTEKSKFSGIGRFFKKGE